MVDWLILYEHGYSPKLKSYVKLNNTYQLTTLQFAALIGISLLEESVGGLLGHVKGLHHGLQFVNINGAITIVVLKEIYLLIFFGVGLVGLRCRIS